MAIPTLRELQASLRQLHTHRSNETTARRFYTDGFLYLVEGKAKCWWCRLETQGVATEMLQLFSIQKTTHTEQFKQALAEQLTSCPNCIYAYYNAKRVLYKRYCQIYEPKNVDLVFNGIEKWDEQRILLQFSRALLPDSFEGRMALIEALAGAENLLFHPDIESAACSFICQTIKKGIRVDTGNMLLPGQLTLCFARNQKVRAWARHSLRRLGKDARLSSKIMQFLFSGLFKQAANSISAPKTLLPLTDPESRASSITFMYSADSIWEGLHEVFARLDKPSMQDLVEHFDSLPVLAQHAVMKVSGPEFFDALKVFSKVIGVLEPSQVWTKISAATQVTPNSFVEHLFGRDEMRRRILDCSTASDDLGEENLMLCNRHFRPVSDWITPFIGSLELPADTPVVVTLLNELILRIRSDAKVPLTSSVLAVHTGIAIIMHCLKLPPAKNLDSLGRFILADFLNQHIQIFVDIAQGRSALSGSELLITSTEELIDLMIREELDWSLTTVSDISDQAQALCRISGSQSAMDIKPTEHPPVLSHFTVLWPAVLQDPENTIVFKQTLYGASYMLLFDPLPANLLSCLPSTWRQVYTQFEARRTSIASMLKQLLETVSASLEKVEADLRNELEKDILLTQMRLLVSPAKSIYSEVLRVLRVSMLDGSDDDFDQLGFNTSKGSLELTDSERDMACSELYERHGEMFINCLTDIVHDCRVLVSYNRPAYSCCKNIALITRSLLSIFSGSKLPQVSKSLAQLFYGFCGLLGSILKLNTDNIVLLGESNGVYVTAITAVFRTVYDMLTSAEFSDFVHLAKNGQGVNEDEAMDALSTCVSQMLIYLQREDVLDVGSQIVRTFGLVASGLAAIPGRIYDISRPA
ncbi:SEN1 N terminal-domain-containing protein, partial [Coemansia mojavensis]